MHQIKSGCTLGVTISTLLQLSIHGIHDYNVSNTKANFRLFHLTCLCSSGFGSSPQHTPIKQSTDHLGPD